MKEELPFLYLTAKLMFSKTWYYIKCSSLSLQKRHTFTYAYFTSFFPTLTISLKFDREMNSQSTISAIFYHSQQ